MANVSIDTNKLIDAGFQMVQFERIQMFHLQTSLGKLPLAREAIRQSPVGREIIRIQEQQFCKRAEDLMVTLEMPKDGTFVQWLLEAEQELDIDANFEIYQGRDLKEGLRSLELVVRDLSADTTRT